MAHAPMLTLWAGHVDYQQALDWQERLVTVRQQDSIDDILLTLSHEPIFTAGKHADVDANVTGTQPGIPVVTIDRGGDLTYHGPGQVVAYPIMRLADAKAAKRYVTQLEQALIDTVATYGIIATRRPSYPGVWVGMDKIAAVGVRVTRRVTKHGVALNVSPDLSHFSGIIPCGISEGGVTSLQALGVDADVPEVADRLTRALSTHLERTPRRVTLAQIGLFPTPAGPSPC